jgi:integrating conjugative element protein (TIGR03749 family)
MADLNLKNGVLALLFVSALSHPADHINTVTWRQQPIRFTIPVNKGITIYLPEGDWSTGISSPLLDKLEHYGTGNIIYLTASQPFTPALIPFREIDSEQQILLVVEATDDAEETDLRITEHATKDPEKSKGITGKPTDVTRALTRHAALTLYAPRRLRPKDARIRSYPVKKKEFQAYDHALMPDDECIPTKDLKASPLYSWRSGNTYVTAVVIRNTGSKTITIDPRGCHVKGQFLTTTAQHSYVEPKYLDNCQPVKRVITSNATNTESNSVAPRDSQQKQRKTIRDDSHCTRSMRDTTTLYVTSQQPFWEVVE